MHASGKPCAMPAMDADGNISTESEARGATFGIAPPHIIYNDTNLIAAIDLFSLKQDNFVEIMLQISKFATIIRKFYDVGRCALVTEGSDSLSLLPLHGLTQEWQPITSSSKEFHELFPGYISSKDGTQKDASRLDICSMIQRIPSVSQPFNYYFEGNHSDKNLFARIVRGEISQWRVWEDDRHVAFLSPSANTPCFTVLVPRVHLSSDIFSLDAEAYSEIVAAAHTVARILKQAFGADRCGMIFEGFEIDYAHIKLIPVHKPSETDEWPSSGHSIRESAFEEKYEGYVTSLNGPKIKDVQSLTADDACIRKSQANTAYTVKVCPRGDV